MPKNKNNATAIMVGMAMIALVAVITFTRAYWNSQKSSENPKTFQQNSDQSNGISATDAFQKINNRENITFIDIRSADFFKAEHILDSKNMSVEEIGMNLEFFDKNASYIFIGETGDEQTKNLVNNVFVPEGFSQAKYLLGGFSMWKQNLYPLISDGDPTLFTDQSKVSYVNCEELKKMMDTQNNLLVVDVRKSNSFSEGHIKNASNIYLEELETRRKEIPFGKKIVVYDMDGVWAMKAAVRLFDMGIFNVHALSEGFNNWKAKGFEVVK